MAKKRGTAIERREALHKEQKYLTRKEFLHDMKYYGKIGMWGTVYGALGNVGGRIADSVIDAYKTTKEALGKVEDTLNKPRDTIDKIFGRQPKPTPKPQPKVSRRGFINHLLNVAYHHPVGAGTVLGAGYGSGKHAIMGFSDYRDQVRRLEERKERITDREERLHLEGVIHELREEMQKLRESASPLEDKISGTEEKVLIGVGTVGLVALIILSASSMTGFSIINSNVPHQGIIAGAVFLVSLIFIKMGLMKARQ